MTSDADKLVARQDTVAVEAHDTLARTIALHLAPGVVMGAVFYALVGPFRDAGIPPINALMITLPLVLIPFELGYLLHRGRRRNGRLSLAGVVVYRQPMPWRSYALLIPLLFVWGFAASAVWGSMFVPSIMDALFWWVPTFIDDPFGLDEPGRYSQAAILATWVVALVLNCFVGPIVEELYFRGHLLPRLAGLGVWAPALNVFLFALYHVWSPWQLPGRVVALLPLVYVVWRRRNIYVAIAVHCAMNTTGMLLVLPRILAAG